MASSKELCFITAVLEADKNKTLEYRVLNIV